MRRLDSLSRRSNWQHVIAVTCAIELSRCEGNRRGSAALWKMMGHWFRVIPLKTSSLSRARSDIGAAPRPRASLSGKNSLSMVREPSTPRYFGPVNGIRRINQATSLVQQRPSIRHSSGCIIATSIILLSTVTFNEREGKRPDARCSRMSGKCRRVNAPLV